MPSYFKITIDGSAAHSFACQISIARAKDTVLPTSNAKHFWQPQPVPAERVRRQQTTYHPRSTWARTSSRSKAHLAKDWASLLHMAAVLYGAPLPKRWTNQVVTLQFEQAGRILAEMCTYRERRRQLKVREFRRLLWQAIGGRTETPATRRCAQAQKAEHQQVDPLLVQQLSLFSLLNELS